MIHTETSVTRYLERWAADHLGDHAPEDSMKNSDSRQPVRDLAASPDYAVLSFASHRARKRSGVASVGRAVYSFRRASKGGYYLVPSTVAADVLDREISGVSRLRAPYSDLLECW